MVEIAYGIPGFRLSRGSISSLSTIRMMPARTKPAASTRIKASTSPKVILAALNLIGVLSAVEMAPITGSRIEKKLSTMYAHKKNAAQLISSNVERTMDLLCKLPVDDKLAWRVWAERKFAITR